MTKPPAALSFDLDNHWSYLKTHGDPAWENFPSYLDRLVPPVLDLLDEMKLRISFFVVGQDAALAKNKAALREIAARGHDIGNHSFRHEPWLSAYSPAEIRREVGDAEQAIADATGRRPRGFRGPGFSWSPALIEALAEAGYLYDATTLPTYLGPLGRLYYFAKSGLTRDERRRRKRLFGGLADGLRPVRPYYWLTPSRRRLLEIPVTTLPLLKIPFHLSYLIYIGRYSPALMEAYIRSAVGLCRLAKTGLSFLLHPLDFLGREDAPGLSFFPGMDVDRKGKLAFFRRAAEAIARSYEIIDLETYARSLAGRPDRLSVRAAASRTADGQAQGGLS